MYPRLRKLWQFARPLLVPSFLTVLAGLLLWEPMESLFRGHEAYDREALQEWVREATVFQTLPDLVDSYLKMRKLQHQWEADLERTHNPKEQGRLRLRLYDLTSLKMENKRREIHEHLKALCEPGTKIYPDRLVLFPVIYKMEVTFPTDPDLPAIIWDSARPYQEDQFKNEPVALYDKFGQPQAWVRLRYRLRVYATLQAQEREKAKQLNRLTALALVFVMVAGLWFYLVQREKRDREKKHLQSRQEMEQKRMQERLKRQESDRKREEAERTALELKSQMFANIGIMAGSYAHNIKNLLVRPNDLLGRCLDLPNLPQDQEQMLREVRQTLGTVTERLQQILQTVRRDPSKSEMVRLDLNQFSAELLRGWEYSANEKWKLTLRLEVGSEPLWISGDRSHLQQALENLLFNARDATFEMRLHLKNQARAGEVALRKQALLVAVAWKGEIGVRVRREDAWVVLEIQDNGIGMTEEVKQRCLETHFSTKRENAIYGGMAAGMGLGLSFVQVILDHHGAKLEVESQPLQGATFRVRFPLVAAPEARTDPAGTEARTT